MHCAQWRLRLVRRRHLVRLCELVIGYSSTYLSRVAGALHENAFSQPTAATSGPLRFFSWRFTVEELHFLIIGPTTGYLEFKVFPSHVLGVAVFLHPPTREMKLKERRREAGNSRRRRRRRGGGPTAFWTLFLASPSIPSTLSQFARYTRSNATVIGVTTF